MNIKANYADIAMTDIVSETGPTGSMPTIITMVLTVAAIGYLANIIEMSSSTTVPLWLRTIGASCPPLGAILGFV